MACFQLAILILLFWLPCVFVYAVHQQVQRGVWPSRRGPTNEGNALLNLHVTRFIAMAAALFSGRRFQPVYACWNFLLRISYVEIWDFRWNVLGMQVGFIWIGSQLHTRKDTAEVCFFCRAVASILIRRLLHKMTDSGAVFIACLHETQYIASMLTAKLAQCIAAS